MLIPEFPPSKRAFLLSTLSSAFTAAGYLLQPSLTAQPISSSMQTNTFAILAISGAAIAAVYATEPCNMSAIKGSLLPNGTTWHESCTAKTGVDVFAMSMFPTKAQAKNISQSRDCVNYINQINQQANTAIQCEITVGDQTIILGELLTDLLKGQTGNKTKETVVGSSSMSGSVSLSSSASASGNASTAGSESASHLHTIPLPNRILSVEAWASFASASLHLLAPASLLLLQDLHDAGIIFHKATYCGDRARDDARSHEETMALAPDGDMLG